MLAVIGGGYAGLAAAYRLRTAGEPVTVFESATDLGGLAATYDTAGEPVEKFYHHLSKSETTIVDVIEELGLADRLSWRTGKNGFYVNGQVHPLDTIWQIAAYPYLSLYDKLRLGLLTLGIDVSGGTPTFDAFDELARYDEIPAIEFIKQHTTMNVYEMFFEPLLRAKFGDRLGEVSAAWLLGRIKFRSERDLRRGEILGYLDGGFQQLTDELVRAVGEDNIETGARVTAIDIASSGLDATVSSVTVERDGSFDRVPVDGVIVATMPQVLESLTGYENRIEFQGTVCSVIATSDPVTGTYWLNILEEAPFGALIEHTNFVPSARYGGEHLLYAVRYVQDLEGSFWRQPDERIEEQWLDAIGAMFPGFERDGISWIKTARAARTAPMYDLGYLERIVPYDLGDDVASGVYYAGMASRAQYPERSLNGALEAGFEAATACLVNR